MKTLLTATASAGALRDRAGQRHERRREAFFDGESWNDREDPDAEDENIQDTDQAVESLERTEEYVFFDFRLGELHTTYVSFSLVCGLPFDRESLKLGGS